MITTYNVTSVSKTHIKALSFKTLKFYRNFKWFTFTIVLSYRPITGYVWCVLAPGGFKLVNKVYFHNKGRFCMKLSWDMGIAAVVAGALTVTAPMHIATGEWKYQCGNHDPFSSPEEFNLVCSSPTLPKAMEDT